jgi:hypothetical protein
VWSQTIELPLLAEHASNTSFSISNFVKPLYYPKTSPSELHTSFLLGIMFKSESKDDHNFPGLTNDILFRNTFPFMCQTFHIKTSLKPCSSICLKPELEAIEKHAEPGVSRRLSYSGLQAASSHPDDSSNINRRAPTLFMRLLNEKTVR